MIQAFSDGVGELSLIHRAQSQLPDIQLVQHRGRVVQLIGLVIESQGPKAALGEICRLNLPQSRRVSWRKWLGFVIKTCC